MVNDKSNVLRQFAVKTSLYKVGDNLTTSQSVPY